MCGISGIIYFKQPASNLSAIVSQMTNAMAHRGPNAEGIFVKDNVALGHRRLSIIDLSNGANQPFTDASGRYRIVFNGEIYNFDTVKAEIKDCAWKTSSDTEVLVEAWARWGIHSLRKFKGMFAFAVWDEQERSLHIVRDRLGIKPLYFFQNDAHLIFASEIRSVLASGLVPKKVNEKAIHDYLSFQSIQSPISIIEGIHQLPAGAYLEIQNGSVEQKRFWDITKPAKHYEYSDVKEVQENIYRLLSNAVQQRLVSDVPIGAFLSGGIDSSAVVALMAKVGSSAPETFNISFDEKEFDESPYAELIAKKYNTNHHKIVLQPTVMLDELSNALNAMDTPSGDGVNTYVVSKAVKQAGITVALSGVGGDELFAGYPFFQKYYKLNQRKGLWNSSLLLRKTAASFLSDNSKWKQLLQTKNAGIEEIYPVLRQVISPYNIKKLTKGYAINDASEINKVLMSCNGALQSFPAFSQVSIADLLGYTQNTLLKDTDQMSMAVALEVREPFFDHELIEYVLGIPDNIKYPHYPKKLLVDSLGDLLPAEVVHRKKQGFVMPWHHWLRNELNEFCSIQIGQLAQRNIFDEGEVKALWSNFNKPSSTIKWMDIWMLVVLNYWLSKNID